MIRVLSNARNLDFHGGMNEQRAARNWKEMQQFDSSPKGEHHYLPKRTSMRRRQGGEDGQKSKVE
jgi:hypothetical protein